MANTYRCTNLTGGASGALDALDGTGLASGDFAITEASETVYFHKLDPSSGAAESSPDVIAPDNNAGDKRWILVDVIMPTHASDHIKGGTDEVDGDKVDIDWNPSNSTPETVAQTDSVDHLSSHLKGIDVALGAKISDVVADTTPQLGGDLDLNQKSVVYDPTPTDDHTWNGHVWTGTAGENLAFGDVCYLKGSDRKFYKVDADAEATTKGLIVMATASISADASGVFLRKGFIRDDSWNWGEAVELYAPTTPGNPTSTKPDGSGDIVRIVAYPFSATVIWFEPDTAYAEV